MRNSSISKQLLTRSFSSITKTTNKQHVFYKTNFHSSSLRSFYKTCHAFELQKNTEDGQEQNIKKEKTFSTENEDTEGDHVQQNSHAKEDPSKKDKENVGQMKDTSSESGHNSVSTDTPTSEESKEGFPWSKIMYWSFSILCGSGVAYYILNRGESNNQTVSEKVRVTPGKSRNITQEALVGGSFTLVDSLTGRPITDSEFRGKWMLVYFGFCNCADICPEELRRMSEAVELVKDKNLRSNITPIFISVDTPRDSCEAITQYLKDFHPSFVGLTGTPEQIKRACKKYRAYYAIPKFEEGKDYIVDHSSYIYLMDPKGYFAQFFSSTSTPQSIADSIVQNVKQYPAILEERKQRKRREKMLQRQKE